MFIIPPESEWLSVKDVARIYKITEYRVRYAHRKGRMNKSRTKLVRLEMFHTFSGLMTTRKLVDEFLGRLNG